MLDGADNLFVIALNNPNSSPKSDVFTIEADAAHLFFDGG